ncbi:hypothetical protein QTP70_009264 [Hemibagrus guttatus]|uniref:Uncharacterized protein n=1 Tax=Hemibagrus guttatus TaxID=175788 RepID=A0AAE0UVQ5_9TELE|nr:hypothetical protein QTP70_009264 [Hemibagrus guttatus]KAK3555073.1 hypothetical protein QTP86_007985 [Hemibagrus guttatus]
MRRKRLEKIATAPLTPLPGIEPVWEGTDESRLRPPPSSRQPSSGKMSPESVRSIGAPSVSSEDGSRAKKTEATTPIELISRGPDGRFVMDPTDIDTPVKPRRIEGFPFVEDQESYLQPPAYSPRFQRPIEGMTIMESSRLQAMGQIRGAPHFRAFSHGQFYLGSYLGSPGEPEPPPPFYMPDTSPLSSVMSSPPYHLEGPFGHPTIPEEISEGEIPHYAVSGCSLPLTHTSSRSPDIWQRPDFSFATFEGPHFIFPPHHPLQFHREPSLPPPLILPPSALPPASIHIPSYPGILQLEAPKSRLGKSPSKVKPQGLPAKHLPMQEAQSLGQLRHTSHGMGVPVLPYPDTASHIVGPSSFGSLDTRWYELTPRLSPRQPRRMEPSMVVLQPSRLSPLTQSPISSHEGSPEIVVRPRPRPSIVQPSIPPEMSEITLQPPSSVSFSKRSSPSSSPAQGQGSRRASPIYRSHMAFGTSATSYPSQSPSPLMESSSIFGQMPTQRRSEEEILPSEPSPPQLSASGKHRGTPSGPAGSERIEALRYQRVKKAKKVAVNNNNSKARKKMGVSTSQTQQPHTSQVLPPEEALYLRKKKRKLTRQDPYTRFSALLYRRPPQDDQKAILASMDIVDPDHATFL